MRKIFYSREIRHPVRFWVALFVTLSALILLGTALLPQGHFEWKLWGFETYNFTVEDEQIQMRLDTSGAGRYETALADSTVSIFRDEELLLEGYFISAAEYGDWAAAVRSTGDWSVIEDTPALLLYQYSEADGAGYAFLARIENSGLAAAFDLPGAETAEEAWDCAQRLQFTRRN